MKTVARARPVKVETWLSAGILALLVAVGAGVFWQQDQINPGVVALRPDSRQQAPARDAGPLVPLDAAASGIVAFSAPEHFGPETLFEKINGRADLYLEAGFVSLATQRFAADADGDQWVELFVYDMASAENAYSVFSLQRREGARDDDMIANAYRTENALFMVHGSHYLEIIAADDDEALQQVMGTLAHMFIDSHGGTATAPVPGQNLLPAQGREPDSLRLIASNAFGFEGMDRVYTADFQVDGHRLTAFVSERQTPAEAAALAADYRQALVSYGAAIVEAPLPVDHAAVVQVFDTYEIVLHYGRYLAGVHEADDLDRATRLAQQLVDHLKTAARP
jgi:hypothetical protein